MSQWDVSADAADLHADAFVWDMTIPIITPGRPELRSAVWPRFAAAGFDAVSITIAVDLMDFENALQSLAFHRRLTANEQVGCLRRLPDQFLLQGHGPGIIALQGIECREALQNLRVFLVRLAVEFLGVLHNMLNGGVHRTDNIRREACARLLVV